VIATLICRALLLLLAVAGFGCAAYQPPALMATHPASPEAPTARLPSPSQTLAYSRSDAEAIRMVAPPAPPHGAHGASGSAGKTVVGEGEVVATTLSTGQIVVDHGEIKGFMEAMTMGYRTDPPSLLTTVKAGDKIRFTIDVERRAIVGIEPLK
jgi:Cu/Ag efflux protein CusF